MTANENELSRVIDGLPGMVWTALPDGHIDFLNQRWCEYTGMSADEACGRGWTTAIHPGDLAQLLDGWRFSLAYGVPGDMQARLRRFDGQYRWFVFSARPLTDAAGQIVKWCGTNTDVEDRVRAAEEAERAREWDFRVIADSIPALILVMTPDGTVERGNRHLLEYYGATLEELKGWASSDILHPDDRAAVMDAWRRSGDAAGPLDIEFRGRRADGIYRWFHARGLPVTDAGGRVTHFYVLQTDIEDRKRAEALLVAENQLLEMVAGGCSMSEVLEALCRLVESIASGFYCSVVLVDPSGKRLEHGAAPSLPTSFITSIIGRPVNVDSGPCAMAACLNEQVIAADLTSETRWAAYEWCSMALAHGLQSCWSTPFSSTAGKVLGAFAIYYDEPMTPTLFHQSLIERLRHIASIAVERAQGAAALKRSEARKSAILDSALDCILTIDHEGCITEFNPAAERTFGFRRNEVLGRRLGDVIIPPSLREQHRQGLARYLTTGEEHVLGRHIEMTAIRGDGSEFPVELAITRIPLDGPPSFTGYLRDITERKQSEEHLQRSEAFLAEAQHLSSTGSFSWRAATDEITWSEQVYRIFEFEPGTPVTLERISSRVHPEDAPMVFEMIGRARGGGDFEYENRLQMPDDSIKYVHTIAHETRDQNGQLEYVGAVQDVTERRLSEEALGNARSELAHVARVTSLGALTASIAHEVNQPLAGIITNASTCLRMLAGDPPNLEGARETARRMIRDGNRAADVIARLRALFSNKEGAIEQVDLNEATREVLAVCSELQRGRAIVRAELADNLPPITGDRVQLQQVVMNLLVNASEGMSTVEDRPRQLVVRTEPYDNDQVRLSVQDAGVGFDPDDVERLFDAFYTTKPGGLGIGLSVSRSIIESHHGHLWAETNDGPGATFSFALPCLAL